MEAETKICQNCKQTFIIEPEDFVFYEKMKVPPPTLCVDCRRVRRLIWRNERTLHRRKCDVPGHDEMLISMYSPQSPVTVYDHKYWWSDEWDPMQYGREYDFSRPFFDQWKALLYETPTPALINIDAVNSDYCNFTYQSKNCYLNFASDMNEDTAYLYHSIHNRNCCDMLGAAKNENCYELVDCEGCYDSDNLILSDACMNCEYSYDCRNCQNCVGCVGLRNAKYCILNEKYSATEYKIRCEGLGLHTRTGRQKFAEQCAKLMLGYPRKFSNSRHTVNSTGDYLKEVKNSHDCFDIEGPMEDSRFVIYGVTDMRNVHDAFAVGVNIENCYEVMDAGSNLQDAAFSGNVWDGFALRYCYFLRNCSNCFGCVGLRNKQYCILNKQYTKEGYIALIARIEVQMDKACEYGEFFPAELSPFAYNESAVQDYFPLTKKEALQRGFLWRNSEERDYHISMKTEDVPQNIADVPGSIIADVIACKHGGDCNDQCTIAFKIIPQELQLYKKIGVPLPDLCPNCRHHGRLKLRNPLKLWSRTCQCKGGESENGIYKNSAKHFHGDGHCVNEFKTTYAPERPEIVYCEQCYNAEIV